jgi:hypothetical protein
LANAASAVEAAEQVKAQAAAFIFHRLELPSLQTDLKRGAIGNRLQLIHLHLPPSLVVASLMMGSLRAWRRRARG